MIASATEEAFNAVPDIIKAAAVSPLGIFALMIICLSVLGIVWFKKTENHYVKLGIFLCLFAGVIAFGFSILNATPTPVQPTPAPIDAEETTRNAGRYYQAGQWDQAMPLFRSAAEAGNGEAAFYLGNMYASGHGLPKDDAQAVKWHRKAAEAGSSNGMYILGTDYLTVAD